MSRATRIAVYTALAVLALAVVAYAVTTTTRMQARIDEAKRVAQQAGTVQPLNVRAPAIVAQTLEPAGDVERRGTILFDMAHSEVFGPQDTSELGQSAAVDRMRAGGYAVKVTTEKISASALSSDVAAVYLPGPMVPFMDKERTVLDDFVRRGGTMVITVHVPYPILGTPARYGLPVGTGVMTDPQIQTGDPGVWVTDRVVRDPLTAGITRISVVSGWPVRTSKSEIADPKLVVFAPPAVVVDANGDGAFTAADPQPPYGVVGVATIGSGRVVILGDDAIFANIAINTYDNAKLLDNLLDLIAAPKPI